MKTFPDTLIPAHEKSRLGELAQYNILHSRQEILFEGYATLGTALFNIPVCLISLVGEEKVWFKANKGLPGVKEMKRNESFCSLTILQSEAVVFEDLDQESCPLINEAAVRSAGIRFYAGASLKVEGGFQLGTVCVMDKKARFFPKENTQLLEQLTQLVSLTIELRHFCLQQQGGLVQWESLQKELALQIQDKIQQAKQIHRVIDKTKAGALRFAILEQLQEFGKILREHHTYLSILQE